MTQSKRRARHGAPMLAGLLVCALAQASAAAPLSETLTADDFARGRTLTTSTSRALQSAILDLDVYRNSVEDDLADLRVFNHSGEAVPHAVRRTRSAPDSEPRVEPLPVFRLHPVAEQTSEIAGYQIDAEVSESGAILRLRGGGPARTGPATSGAWLVDASALRGQSIVALELELAASAGDFIGYVSISSSDDLTRFRMRTERAAVARLARAGHEIERLDVTLPATRARYLKLELVEGVLPAELQGVQATLSTGPAPIERHHTRVGGVAVDDEPGHYVYDLGAHPPIDRIDVLVDEPNSVIEVLVESAMDREGPWVLRHAGLVYRIDQGATLRSPAIVWRGGDHRYLRLMIAAKGGGHAAGPPEIELAWRPEQLLFVARGEPPFMLVYGKRGAADTAFSAGRLVSIAGEPGRALDEASASLGPPGWLAGESAFDEPKAPLAWRQIVLWAVLILAVGVVLALSARLLREVGEQTGEGAG